VFHAYHSEHEMLRYIKRLEGARPVAHPLDDPARLVHDEAQRDHRDAAGHLAGVRPACTRSRRPSRPPATARFDQLEGWLAEITGFAAVSLQPNAGSQGEYAGLLVIRAYHRSRGEAHRDVCLIPVSAHGTNPASAVMAGMRVVVVACDEHGNIDVADLAAKAEAHATGWRR
jgi:glycine dehydrogenase